jgi:hypothetical protein
VDLSYPLSSKFPAFKSRSLWPIHRYQVYILTSVDFQDSMHTSKSPLRTLYYAPPNPLDCFPLSVSIPNLRPESDSVVDLLTSNLTTVMESCREHLWALNDIRLFFLLRIANMKFDPEFCLSLYVAGASSLCGWFLKEYPSLRRVTSVHNSVLSLLKSKANLN